MLKTLAVSASVLAFTSGYGLAESTLSTGQWLASDIYMFMILPNTKLAMSGIL